MKFLSNVLLSTAAIAGILSSVTPDAIAQTPDTMTPGSANNTGTFQSNEIDAFDGIEQGSFNPLDLFHMMNMGGRRSLGQFRQEQNNNLDNATQEFRRQQLELLNDDNQNAPVVPESPEAPPEL